MTTAKKGGFEELFGWALLGLIGLAFATSAINYTVPRVLYWWDDSFRPWWHDTVPFLIAGFVFGVVCPAVIYGYLRFGDRTRRAIQKRVERRQPDDIPTKPKVRDDTRLDALDGDHEIVIPMPKDKVTTEKKAKQLADHHGRDVFGEPADYEVRVNRKSGRDEVVLRRPVEAEVRDPFETKLETVASQILPQVTRLRVESDPAGVPTRVVIEHDPAEKAINDEGVADRIEQALRRRLQWEEHTYRVVLDYVNDRIILERWTDPLAAPIAALPFTAPDKTILESLPVGVRDDGSPSFLNLSGGRHTLIAGATGAGKSSLIHSALRATAPTVHAGLVQNRGLCPKGGAELGKARGLFYDLAAGPVNSKGPAARFQPEEGMDLLAVEQARQLDLLQRAGHDLLMRAYRLGAQGVRQHVATVEEPAVLVWIDEIALVTSYMGTKQDREAASMAVAAVVTQGRAWLVHLIAALQDPRMETLRIRNLFPVKIGMRLDRRIEVDMVLGDGRRVEGAYCDRIDPATPGIYYRVEDGAGAPTRHRAAYVTDADIEETCKRFPAPDWKPPPPIGDMDFREAVKSMVPAETVKAVAGALDEAARVVDPPARPAKKAVARRPRKVAAKPVAGGPEVIGRDTKKPDEVERGDWVRIPDGDGGTRDVRVAELDVDDDTDAVTASGLGWEYTWEAGDPVLALHVK